MPTLGGHFTDDIAEIVKQAAKASEEKQVGPYISAAVRQRLEREGYIANTPRNTVRELALAVADMIGEEAVIVALATVKADVSAKRAATAA